jgi:hypothetical protein
MKTPRYSFDEENHDELTGDPEGEWCLARDVRKLEAELTKVKEELRLAQRLAYKFDEHLTTDDRKRIAEYRRLDEKEG